MTLLLVAIALAEDSPARLAARAVTDCDASIPLWREVRKEAPDDLEALTALADCVGPGATRIDDLVANTSRLIGESRLLRLVPALLDEANLKDVVPILNAVESAPNRSLADTVALGRLYRELNDPEHAVALLRAAVTLDPLSTEVHLELGHALVAAGDLPGARDAFREGLARGERGPLPVRLYAAAVAFPGLFLPLCLPVIVLAGWLWGRRNRGWVEEVAGVDVTRRFLPLAVLLPTAILAVRFGTTGHRTPFLVLSMGAFAASLWLVTVPFRVSAAGVAAVASQRFEQLATGHIWPLLVRLSVPQQVTILALSLAVMVGIVPLIPSADVLLVVAFLDLVLLVSALGSLLLVVLNEAPSLRRSLRMLAVGGTLPYLGMFLYLERTALLHALVSWEGLSWTTINRLVAYVIVWGVGVGSALLLARILSSSILAPVDRIVAAIAAIRGGDFTTRTGVSRRDEVGDLAAAVDEMAVGLAQRERIKTAFRQFIDPAVAERLITDDADALRGRRLRATVLFSDIRGFTSLSERVSPEDLVAMLNDYFAVMAPIVAAHGGVVDKFIGDGMLAVWGVPSGIDEPEKRAVRAGLAMGEALGGINRTLVARGLPAIGIGVGINTGDVVAAIIGSPDRKEYTVVGDVVNTAQRAESAARGDTPLLVTAAVAWRVRREFRLVPTVPLPLKGKRRPVRLYAVVG